MPLAPNLLTTGHYLVQMKEQFQPGLSSGYAVMTRIRVVDHWTWATWMCFDTYAQAVAHARKGDKVVRFASAAWVTLKQQESAAQAQQSDTASPVHTRTTDPAFKSRRRTVRRIRASAPEYARFSRNNP